jgi:cytochrome c biogenesis protein ResB
VSFRVPQPPRSAWFRRLASAKLAAWLIGALALIAVLGVIIPQRTLLTAEMMSEFESSLPLLARGIALTGLDGLFVGWPLALVTGLLALNLVACTWRRLAAYTRGPSLALAPVIETVASGSDREDGGRAVLDDAEEYMSASGWSVLRDADRLLGIKGRAGFWGSMLLHAALLIIMVGGVLATMTYFSGEILLAEGQTSIDEPESYLGVSTEPELGEAYSGARLTMERMRFFYEGDVLVRAVATMSGESVDGRTARHETRVNHPFDFESKSFLLRDSGLTSDLRLETANGEESFSVSLANETPFGWEDTVVIPTPEGPVEIVLLASPVPLGAGEVMPARKFEVTEPRLGVWRADDSDGAMLAALGPGESVTIAEGATLTFEGVRFWSQFLVRKDDARWVVYLGLWLSVIGTLWRFVQPERHLSVCVRDGSEVAPAISIGYRARPWRGMIVAGDRGDIDRITDIIAEADDR